MLVQSQAVQNVNQNENAQDTQSVKFTDEPVHPTSASVSATSQTAVKTVQESQAIHSNYSSQSFSSSTSVAYRQNNTSVNKSNYVSQNGYSVTRTTNSDTTNVRSNVGNNKQVIANNEVNSNQSKVKVTNNQFTSTPANAPITDKMPQAKDNYHTPDYHIHNAQGWSNDVQTITQNPDGSYNIYFLHSVDGATNPFGPNGQDWEHVTTKDWIHFSDEGISINSHGTNNPNSWKSAWTGSVITNNGDIAGVPKGAEVAYFSGLSKKDGSQNIWGAWSDDGGKTFTHALNDGAPVLAWNQAGASGKKDQERDADVIYWNNELLMYCAEGDQLGVYKSTDGVHWTKADPNGQSKVLGSTFFRGLNWTSADIPVECPQIRTMKTPNGQTKTVLFYGTKGASDNPAQTTGTYYIVGHLDQNGLFVPETNARRLDLGSDYYGTNVNGNDSLNDAHSSLIGLGWVGNWNYTSQGVYDNQNAHQYPADKSQLENHLGAYTLPRTLVLGNNLQISATPDVHLNEGQTYTATTNKPSNANGQKEDMGKDNNYGDVYDLIDHANDPADQIYNLHFSTTNGSNYQGRIYININQGKDRLTFNYDPDNGMMMVNGYAEELDNDISGSKASSSYYDGALGKGQGYLVNTGYVGNNGQHKQYDIEVFCDKTSVELFFPNGQVYTVARYATNDTQDFKVYTQDPNGVNQVTETKQSLIPTTQTSNCSNNGKNNPSGLFPGDSNEYSQASKPSSSQSNNKGSANQTSAGKTSQSSAKPSAGKVSAASSQTKGSVSANKPVTGSASAANKSSQAKGSQAGSASKGSASVADQSRKPASNPNDVQHGGNTSASAAKGSTSTNKPVASVGNKASQAKGSQAGGHTASAGKGSVSASASAGKTSTIPTNKASQGSAAVKDSVSASKTQAQSQSANGSAAKGSVSVNQSSAASQSGKGNQWQSQGQHVNVIKHPAKVVKASAPVAQLAAKRVALAPAEETTAPVAEQTSTPVETAASAAKAATSSAVQSSGSSSSSMPNTGMSNEAAVELGMVGVGLVLGIAAKRKNKKE